METERNQSIWFRLMKMVCDVAWIQRRGTWRGRGEEEISADHELER
jgi:hypothetical protein